MHVNDLIAGCINGGQRYFDELYEVYSRRLYGICLRYSADQEEAKDILQDGFVKLFGQLKKFDSTKGSFEGWIKRMFVNHAIDYYRKRKKQPEFVSSEDFAEEIHPEEEELQYDLSENEILELIRALPDGYRMVFNLFVIEELSHKEISMILGISENTSKSQFHKARKMLREKIEQLLLVNHKK